MIDIEKGRYWDEGVKLVSGCTKCSPGCDHCWSLSMEKRFKLFGPEVKTHPESLKRFNTRKPKVFAIWNDLFHEAVPFEFVNSVLFKMYGVGRIHDFLILTKRHERMVQYVAHNRPDYWPLENVYLGLTVCNQQEADEKIPIFLQVPGKKFLSIEPMLGAIDLRKKASRAFTMLSRFYGNSGFDQSGSQPEIDRESMFPAIDAVILGGETGPGARPLHPDWVRSVRDQCAAAGVPFFFKQWGEWAPARFEKAEGCINHTNGHYWFEFDPDCGNFIKKIGKKKAGRLLDGRTHDELPWRKA